MEKTKFITHTGYKGISCRHLCIAVGGFSTQTLKHPTVNMHSNGYEAQSDEGCSSASRSTFDGRQSIGDPLSDRRRIHEIYAAQYRQEAEKGVPRLGYLPLSQEPLRNSNFHRSSDEWQPSTNLSESSRGSYLVPTPLPICSLHILLFLYVYGCGPPMCMPLK